MDTRPIRHHPLIPPLLIGIFSLLGLCTILVLVFRPTQTAAFVPTRTSTAFKYEFLATETQIPVLTPASETAEFRVAPTATSLPTNSTTQVPESTPVFVATSVATQRNGNVGATATSFTATLTMTLEPILGTSTPLPTGKYDNNAPGFRYIGAWNVEENSYAYQETVLVSEVVGDYVAFSFIGLQLMLGYQSSDDAGEFRVSIDGVEESMNQQAGSIWFSDYLESGTHHAIITHTGAGPVNVDYIEIAE
jgi:hypothetical protein